MEELSFLGLSLPKDVVHSLLSATNQSSLEKTLQILIESSRTNDGRSELSSKAMLPKILQLIQSLPYPSGRLYLMLSLKLLRNLCAGNISSQSSFTDQNGVRVVSSILKSGMLNLDPDYEIIRMGLQVLANVSLAGEQHQRVIWDQFFPHEFKTLAKIRKMETFDPLCMIIYTCCDGSPQIFEEFCTDQGLVTLAETVQTGSAVGFGEDWFKILLSRTCVDEVHFVALFSKLSHVGVSQNSEDVSDIKDDDIFSTEQAFLLRVISDIVNERIKEIVVPSDTALYVLEIFRKTVQIVDSAPPTKSGLPTGSTLVNVLGYSLTILRDICARESFEDVKAGPGDVVELLLSSGLLQLLFSVLHDLGPPEMIRKTLKQNTNKEEAKASSNSIMSCPYRGFRRDIVAIIGNCTYKRKQVQDEIREKNGILLLLQQCTTEEENPFLREWGIWSVRNLMEGNEENQRLVADMELQGSVDVPELNRLGLRVEVDRNTRRAKLVNTT